jgi:hypothetical protein
MSEKKRESTQARATSSGPDLYIERGGQVIENDERKPLLYDARGRALVRRAGFRPDGR